MTMKLKGKVAFITGAAGGLGKGFTEGLLANGAKVYMTDISAEQGESALQEFQTKFGTDKVCFSVMDVTSDLQFQEVFDKAVKTFGNIDFMINNAGILNEVDFNLVVNVNLGGVMRGTKIAENHMRTDRGGKGGRIVNMSSLYGLIHPYQAPLYAASKHGVRAFTSCLANQEDKKKLGLQYATLCPNIVEEGMINQTMDESKWPAEYQDIWDSSQKNVPRIPLSKTVDAMIELLTLETMSGAILRLEIEGNDYQDMEPVSLGKTYPPVTTKNT